VSKATERVRRSFRRAAAGSADAGFTLVELLVASAVFAVVLTAVLSLLDTSNQVSYNDQERNVALHEQTDSLRRMTQELRQAYHVVGVDTSGANGGGNWVDVLVRVTRNGAATELRVLYDCYGPVLATGLQQCTRAEAPASLPPPQGSGPPPGSSSGTAQVVIPRVVNGTAADPVFTGYASPNDASYPGDGSEPTYVQVTLKTPVRGARTVGSPAQTQLFDSVYMRNTDNDH
jgi:prepilin-type N-terminal cleavage/methylation domain-containing protein